MLNRTTIEKWENPGAILPTMDERKEILLKLAATEIKAAVSKHLASDLQDDYARVTLDGVVREGATVVVNESNALFKKADEEIEGQWRTWRQLEADQAWEEKYEGEAIANYMAANNCSEEEARVGAYKQLELEQRQEEAGTSRKKRSVSYTRQEFKDKLEAAKKKTRVDMENEYKDKIREGAEASSHMDRLEGELGEERKEVERLKEKLAAAEASMKAGEIAKAAMMGWIQANKHAVQIAPDGACMIVPNTMPPPVARNEMSGGSVRGHSPFQAMQHSPNDRDTASAAAYSPAGM